jgi:hypothetical protein
MQMNVNSRTRLAESRITQIRLHHKTPGIIDFSGGKNQVDGRFHAALQGGNRTTLIGRIQCDSNQAQGDYQHQRSQQNQAQAQRKRAL